MPNNNTSLYGTSQSTTNIAGSNLTSLYPTDNVPVPPLTGDLVVTGNLIVQGGNIITDAATASIFNTTATTVNIGGNASTVSIGGSTGTTTINNNLAIGGTFSAPNASFTNLTVTNPIVGQVTSLANHTTTDLPEGTNLYYTTQRARSAISAGTGISYNPATGVITNTGGGGGGAVSSVNGFTGAVSLTTTNIPEGAPNLYYTNARARASLSAGAGITYNATTGVISATSTGGVVSVNGKTGVVSLNSDDIPQGATNLYFSNALARGALSGGTGVTYSSSTGVIAIGQDVATSASPNFVNMTLAGDIAVNGGDLTTNQTTFNLLNATATTINMGGAATAVSIGAGTGTTTINNANTVVAGDLAINGGDLTTNQTTFNLINTTATTANIAGAATAVNIGATTGTTTVRNALTARSTLTLNGSTSGFVSFTTPATAGSQAYTLPTAYPGTSGYVLAATTGGVLSWVQKADTNTTYTIDASSTTGGANFNLRGSDSSIDTIKFAGAGATTVTATDVNTITVSSTDTNTTYSMNASSTTGGANLNLAGSDSSTSTVKIASGTGITVAQNSSGQITITNSSPGGSGVTSITGTANQIIASASTGAVTLSTPQDIATTSAVTFFNVNANNYLQCLGNTFLGSNSYADSTTVNGILFVKGAGDVNILKVDSTTGTTVIGANTNSTTQVTGNLTVKNGNFDQYSGTTQVTSSRVTITTTATTATQTLMQFTGDGSGNNAYATVKFLVQIISGTDYQAIELLGLCNPTGDNTRLVQYADVKTGTVDLATFSMERITNGTFRLLGTPTNAVTTFKVFATAITT